MTNAANVVVGIDVGGTFTDLLAFDVASGQIIAAIRVPSTPDTGTMRAFTQCHQEHGLQVAAVCHATTIGTNTLIDKRGAHVSATRIFRLRRH
ncbi:MAG: hypothetical protein HOI95_07090 [Chromatiales bacterium]|nr:hypothetical protein [Chromatiales bacterium]